MLSAAPASSQRLSTTYSHQQWCAVLVHPDQQQVLPMAVEAVCNGGDGTARPKTTVNGAPGPGWFRSWLRSIDALNGP